MRHTPALLYAMIEDYLALNGKQPEVCGQLLDVIKKLDEDDVCPQGLVNVIFKKFKDSFQVGEQLDIVELWCLLTDEIQNEVCQDDVRPAITPVTDNEKIDYVRRQYNKNKTCSLINAIQGSHVTTLACPCGFSQGTPEVFTMVNLDIEDATEGGPKVAIMNLIGKYMSMESASDWKCDKCKKVGKATRQYHIWDAPKVFVVSLKRFKESSSGSSSGEGGAGGYEKIKTPVDVTDGFSMTVHGDEKKVTYVLLAIGQHHGDLAGGHYTAVCRTQEGWILYDDTNVIPLGKNLVYDKTGAYFFVYQSISARVPDM